MTGHEQLFISRQFLSVFFSWSQGANVAFLTQWRMFEFEIGGCSCFLFFLWLHFFRRSLARNGNWQTSDFLSVSGGVGYRAYPISFSMAGANPCWKLKCGCCSSIDASCCYMAWLRLKSCVPRFISFSNRVYHREYLTPVLLYYCSSFFPGLGQHLDFFLVPQFHMTV